MKVIPARNVSHMSSSNKRQRNAGGSDMRPTGLEREELFYLLVLNSDEKGQVEDDNWYETALKAVL